MITFVKFKKSKSTIFTTISEEAFTTFVSFLAWAIKSGNPCWAEACGAAENVRRIIRSVSTDTMNEIIKIIKPLPFSISGTQFRDNIYDMHDPSKNEYFEMLFGSDADFSFTNENHLSDNAKTIIKAMEDNLVDDTDAMAIIDEIKSKIRYVE
jgi:hypothetical protein